MSVILKAHAQEETASTRQPDIFAKIIEESLSDAGLGEWIAGPAGLRAALGTGIRGEYLPTVGVLMHVPVSFPIFEPEPQTESVEPPAPPSDLWEKYSKADGGAHGLPLDADAVRREIWTARTENGGPKSGVTDSVVEKTIRMDELDRKRRVAISSTGLSGPAEDISFDITLPAGSVPAYDSERVAKFNDALLDAVAKYGHRLTCIGDSERLLIVVEGPSPNVRRRSLTFSSGGAEPFTLALPRLAGLDAPKERKLLIVPRSAIAASTDRATLSPQVSETRY
ncbi:MAG: hypothetical protein HUU46_03870 [Candidatus Hydrogenedentes bacterium]|nr:hypothetical protein [Candidatus Hydrogenedentota bacterium]